MRYLLYCLKICFSIIIILKFGGCSEKPPVTPDGGSKISLLVLWNSTGKDDGLVKISNAKVILISEYGAMIKYTDENGLLVIENLPSANYYISVISKLPDDNKIILSGNIENLFLGSDIACSDTLYVKACSNSGLVLNEIYSAGPITSTYYSWDQFIELYNSSDSVKYLDGCQIAKMVSSVNNDSLVADAGVDIYHDGQIHTVKSISKFPGKPGEKNIPLQPKSFLVLAVDAINHKVYTNNAVDLTDADWEFYNQYMDDIDNPDVPNLINMQPEDTKDFNMGLNVGILIFTNGRDSNLNDGIDINTILDGIEYESKLNHKKTLDSRVDRGQVVSPGRYSGKSLQRREPGLDSNNGLLDWEIINYPTPGYQ